MSYKYLCDDCFDQLERRRKNFDKHYELHRLGFCSDCGSRIEGRKDPAPVRGAFCAPCPNCRGRIRYQSCDRCPKRSDRGLFKNYYTAYYKRK